MEVGLGGHLEALMEAVPEVRLAGQMEVGLVDHLVDLMEADQGARLESRMMGH